MIAHDVARGGIVTQAVAGIVKVAVIYASGGACVVAGGAVIGRRIATKIAAYSAIVTSVTAVACNGFLRPAVLRISWPKME